MVDKKEVLRLTELAYQARRDLCKLCGAYSGNIHMGGDMSMLDVLTCLFHRTMNVSPEREQDPARDRFILSKGHGAVGMYIVMAQKGFFDYQEICETYGQVGSKFGQHPCKTRLPMLDASTGSLGHDKWRAFGWNVIEIADGNDMQQVADALERLPESSSGVPTAVIADTVKGKNISFMEREIKWHAGSMNEADRQTALADLDAALDRQRKEL